MGCSYRPRPQLLPTNMAFPNGLPATASATALFTLVFQRPVSTTFGPADFLIGGLASTAYLRAVPMPGRLPVPSNRLVIAREDQSCLGWYDKMSRSSRQHHTSDRGDRETLSFL